MKSTPQKVGDAAVHIRDFRRVIPGPTWFHAGALGLLGAYFLIFIQTTEGDPAGSLGTAVANIAPAWLLGLAVRKGIRTGLYGLSLGRQIAVHLPLALGFSVGWYLLLNLTLSLLAVPERGRFVMTILTGPALYWQAYQGLLMYGLIAAISTLEALGEKRAPHPSADSLVKEQGPGSILVKLGDQMRPIPIDSIVLVKGADDYCEVWTISSGHYLTRSSLKGLMGRLEGRRFVRIHKSYLVNLDHVARVENVGGGRMSVETVTGQIAPASRVGARMLRDLSV